jgi:hypothetical protein
MSKQGRAYHFMAAALALLMACGSPRAQTPAAAQAVQYPTGTLEQMLAPVALYPDQLLAQILMSAGDPTKVAEFDKWLKSNSKLTGTALQDAAVKAGFEPSFVALAIFPQVVAKMNEQIAWTMKLGEAFKQDRSAVFGSIQTLRRQAQKVGSLKTTAQQEVEIKKTSSGEEVIVIEPANPQIVYVPQYNTQVVYTQAPTTTTVVVQEDDDDAAEAVAAGLIGFTAGIAIGAAFDNDYYYGPYGWGGGGYMYNDAWDDYYDHREDAREDWMDHREDLNENRNDRLEDTSEQRSERAQNAQQQRTERTETRQENRPETAQRATQPAASGASTQSANRTGSTEARGYSEGSRTQPAAKKSGSSDAFSGYSSGSSQRSASSRGKQSRSSSRSGGGGRRK